MEIKNDILQGQNIQFIKSPTFGDEFKPGNLDTIIMHYTGGPAKAAIRSFQDAKLKVSAHLVIMRDGSIVQMVPFNRIAFHAGNSSYKEKVGLNQYSIGIEIENSGNLVKSGNVYRAWFGSAYEANEVIEATHRNETQPRFWQIYSEEQISVVREISQLLIDKYDLKYILGHEEIAPKRKIDPGPAFPLDKIRDQLLKPHRDQNEPEDNKDVPDLGLVAVNKLNFRVEPSTTAALAGPPLNQNSQVKILSESNGWYKIQAICEGWVMAKYIQARR
jgi:N-acetylmuramoyl-L-alanine amidase